MENETKKDIAEIYMLLDEIRAHIKHIEEHLDIMSPVTEQHIENYINYSDLGYSQSFSKCNPYEYEPIRSMDNPPAECLANWDSHTYGENINEVT